MITLAVLETTWGWLGLASTARGLCGLTLPQPTAAQAMTAINNDFPSGAPGTAGGLAGVCEQLWRYFRGERLSLDVPLDLPERPVFWRRVWGIVAMIPYGETRSYGEVAREAGVASAARAVGGAMANNPVPIIIPCHRVVGSDGSLTGFGGGLDMKRRLLDMERAGSPLGEVSPAVQQRPSYR